MYFGHVQHGLHTGIEATRLMSLAALSLLGILLVLPLTASVFYWVAFSLGFRWHTNWLNYLVSMPAGFILLVISLVIVWRRKPSLGGFVESADME